VETKADNKLALPKGLEPVLKQGLSKQHRWLIICMPLLWGQWKLRVCVF